MKTAIICARVSSDDPDQERLDDQLAECRRYAEENGYTVVSEVVENGVSGGTPVEKRPDLWRAIEQLRLGRIQAIIVRELDRLGRRLDTSALVEELAQYGDGVLFTRQPRQDDPEAEIIQLGLGAVIARLERQRIFRRTSTGRNRRAREGKSTLGKLPRWLTWRDEKCVLIENEARRVTAILNTFGVVGGNKLAVEHDLHPSSVFTILTNPQVAGRRYVFPLPSKPIDRAEHQRQRRRVLREITLASTVEEADAIAERHGLIVQEVPRLIDWKRFSEIQQRLLRAGRSQRGRPPKERLPLQGRVQCAVHSLSYTPHRPGTGVIYAECTARRGHNARKYGKCVMPRLPWTEDTRRSRSLVSLVREGLAKALESPEALEKAAKDYLAGLQGRVAQLEAETGDVDSEIEALVDRKTRLALLWADGDMPDDAWQQAKGKLDRAFAQAERRAASVQSSLEELGQTREALRRASEFFQLGDAWVPIKTFMKALGRTKRHFLKDDWMLNKAAQDFGLRIIVEADRLLLEGAIPLGEVPLERAGVKELKSS